MCARSESRKSIIHEGHDIPYELVRRPRVTRHVYLEMADDGGLRVVAPARMSQRAVHNSLQEKSWAVMQFLARVREKQRGRPVFRYEAGENHLFLGWWYPLELHTLWRSKPAGGFDGKRIAVVVRDSDRETVRNAIRRWYRERAMEHFLERLEHYAGLAPWTGGKTPPLRLRRMKQTTGSCSRSGLITMNPHLVKAPAFLVDYVIAHEVCHLEEHNHGKGFYALLNQLYPEWRTARSRLRDEWSLYRSE